MLTPKGGRRASVPEAELSSLSKRSLGIDLLGAVFGTEARDGTKHRADGEKGAHQQAAAGVTACHSGGQC